MQVHGTLNPVIKTIVQGTIPFTNDSSTIVKSPENNSEPFTVLHTGGLFSTYGCVTLQPTPMLVNHTEFSSLGVSYFGLKARQRIIGTRGAAVTAGLGRQKCTILCIPNISVHLPVL